VARPTEHGEIWVAKLDKRRPVVVVSRDDVHGRRQETTVASVTRTVRGIRSEISLDHRDGLPETSAVNCDVLWSIEKAQLERRIGRLSETKIEALDDALRFALQLRPG
jgi:mRNA interferase MazF